MLNRCLLYTQNPAEQIIMTVNALRNSSVFVHVNADQTVLLQFSLVTYHISRLQAMWRHTVFRSLTISLVLPHSCYLAIDTIYNKIF